MTVKPTIYIVDDVQEQLDMISAMLSKSDYEIRSYTTGHEFLQEPEISETGCLLLDNHMPVVTGLEVQLELNRRDSQLPIIFMSGASIYGEVVDAVREGALSFLQKPLKRAELLKEVDRAVEESLRRQEIKSANLKHISLLKSLTPRERQVYDLIIAGHTNKVISVELTISLGTVEFHRANIMKKLKVSTLAELMSISRLSIS